MKQVLLSHDGPVQVYLVPDEVADHLEQYCMEFSGEWIWYDTNGAKLLKEMDGITVACYGAPDFIHYLNEWRFPRQPSKLVAQLDCYGDEIPQEYKDYPQYNF